MRTLLAIPAFAFGVQAQASDFLIVVRTTDAVVVSVTVQCPGESDLVPLLQYEERLPGSATYRVVGGLPPFTLIADEADKNGNVCFTVVDATGREARGCGVIGELYTSRVEGCNGSRSNGIPGGGPASEETPAARLVAEDVKDKASEDRPRVVRRTASRPDPDGGGRPIVREERSKDVRPPVPPPRPQQRDVLRPGGTAPQPSPRRTTSY